jgi:hypothetical protein
MVCLDKVTAQECRAISKAVTNAMCYGKCEFPPCEALTVAPSKAKSQVGVQPGQLHGLGGAHDAMPVGVDLVSLG